MKWKILFTSLVFILLLSYKVYGEDREHKGDINPQYDIIDIENFDGTFVYEEKLDDKELKKERLQGKYEIEDMAVGAIGFDTNNQRMYWDQYTDNYIYNQLTNEEKNLWNTLDDVYFEYLTTDKDFTESTAIVTLNNYSYQDLFNMGYMYIYAHPQYYFLRPRMSAIRYNDNGTIKYNLVIYFYDIFKDGLTRAKETIKVRNKLEDWGKELQKCTTDYDKAFKAHNLICEKISYDNDVIAPNYDWSKDDHLSQTMYSVLCRDKTVCAGYSITFSCLCNYTGLKNTSVTGSGHAWNMVCLDDNWYNIDACWNDGDPIYYKYFLVSDAFLYGHDDSHFKYNYWKPYISVAERNWSGYEEFEGDTYYYSTDYILFGSRIYYALGNAPLGSFSNYNVLPTNFTYPILFPIKIPSISRTGYKFNNWYFLNTTTKANKLTKKNVTSSDDIYLKADWTPTKYKISFEKGVYDKKEKKKVKGKMKDTKSIKYDEGITLPACTYTYPGYRFLGWTKEKKGTTVEYLNCERICNLTDTGKTVKLYAIWQKE